MIVKYFILAIICQYINLKEDIKMEQCLFYSAKEVASMLGVSIGKSYKIIKELNENLEKQGYIVIAGKIPKKYFNEHYYGLA